MKTLYSLLLLVCFVFSTDAQTDAKSPTQEDTKASRVTEVTGIVFSDSTASANKERTEKLLSDSSSLKITKTLFGVASFYSRNLEGTKTATGETFHHNNFTGASNNFKLNSWVRVTNLKNGESVIVRINDRMHPKMAKKGRVVDLIPI